MLWQLGEMSAGKEFQMMEQRRKGGRGQSLRVGCSSNLASRQCCRGRLAGVWSDLVGESGSLIAR